jgi:hypothetical protein
MKIETNFHPAGGGEIKSEKENLSKENKIAALKKRREGITAFRDGTSDDRRILVAIDQEIENLEKDKEREVEEKKKALFARIDIMGGVYSHTNDRTIPSQKIKEIIEKVLSGESPLNAIPRSVILKREENLRQIVADLIELQ